jgi:hypothetical protein
MYDCLDYHGVPFHRIEVKTALMRIMMCCPQEATHRFWPLVLGTWVIRRAFQPGGAGAFGKSTPDMEIEGSTLSPGSAGAK